MNSEAGLHGRTFLLKAGLIILLVRFFLLCWLDWFGGDQESFSEPLQKDFVQNGGRRHFRRLPQASTRHRWQWHLRTAVTMFSFLTARVGLLVDIWLIFFVILYVWVLLKLLTDIWTICRHNWNSLSWILLVLDIYNAAFLPHPFLIKICIQWNLSTKGLRRTTWLLTTVSVNGTQWSTTIKNELWKQPNSLQGSNDLTPSMAFVERFHCISISQWHIPDHLNLKSHTT